MTGKYYLVMAMRLTNCIAISLPIYLPVCHAALVLSSKLLSLYCQTARAK
jgi:hypothetical protein